MAPTIGIDLVEINRFAHWHIYADKRLGRIFSAQEIAYCRTIPSKSAERFAVRFAAKEALFKALAPYASRQMPFLTLCMHAEIELTSSGIAWNINWQPFYEYYTLSKSINISASTSLTHTNTTACAVVIITLLS